MEKDNRLIIKETIVVEGKDDIANVKRAVQAECIQTNGLGFPDGLEARLRFAKARNGIIVLTDPDYSGNKIRNKIEAMVGPCKHAHLSLEHARKNDDIGVENASADAIREALMHARALQTEVIAVFTMQDMMKYHLVHHTDSKKNRIRLGELLGVGYGNAKQLLRRLNHYRISEQEFCTSLDQMRKEGYHV